jgi:periplasmic protein TonB
MSTLTFDSFPAAPRRKAVRVAPRAPAQPVQLAAPPGSAIKPRPQAGAIVLVAAILAVHGGAVVALSGGRHAIAPVAAPAPITISMAPPQKVIPPPPPPEPAPVLRAPRAKAARPAPAPAPVPVVASDVPLVAATTDTVQVSRTPVAPAPAPAPAAPAEEPVTEPRGYAGYLRNPAPEYPPAAQKRGLEGKVLLKVHVLASGQPDSVAVAKSSGHQILDEAALKAVTQWAFAPARRGQTAIDGWVQVPLNFKI